MKPWLNALVGIGALERRVLSAQAQGAAGNQGKALLCFQHAAAAAVAPGSMVSWFV